MKYGCVTVIKSIWYNDYTYCCLVCVVCFTYCLILKIKHWCDFVVTGYLDLHRNLDILVAEYLGVEDAITVPMGFATNSMNMPLLVGKVCIFWVQILNKNDLFLEREILKTEMKSIGIRKSDKEIVSPVAFHNKLEIKSK